MQLVQSNAAPMPSFLPVLPDREQALAPMRARRLRFVVDGRAIEIVLSAGAAGRDLSGAPAAAATIANAALAQAADEEEARLGREAFAAAMMAVGRDVVAESLIRALLAAMAAREASDADSLASIGSALVVRALALCRTRQEVPAPGRSRAPLPAWRLKRVVQFIDAHLQGRITLGEMAAVAGLTRMHFAAQFRRATGMSPHGYLLQRRVERAKALLGDTGRPLVDIALSVGFGTQPHFTTVFKRFAGQTPHRWRQSLDAGAAAM
jgi:AraC-like DNA-binding protein